MTYYLLVFSSISSGKFLRESLHICWSTPFLTKHSLLDVSDKILTDLAQLNTFTIILQLSRNLRDIHGYRRC